MQVLLKYGMTTINSSKSKMESAEVVEHLGSYFKNTFSHRTPPVASSIISPSVLQPRTSKEFGALTRPQAELDTLALCLWPLLVS